MESDESERCDLQRVKTDSLAHIGKVLSTVDELVVVESRRNMPPLDLDTVLFKSDGTPLGLIDDVFGPISFPHYSVRFSNAKEVQEKGVAKDMDVYFVPVSDTSLTKFAFVSELQKLKGSDASWENDAEPPEHAMEYSDDEEEDLAKKQRKAREKQATLQVNTIS